MREHPRQGFRLAAVAAAFVLGALVVVPKAGAVTISASPTSNVFTGEPFIQAAGTGALFANPGAPNTVVHNVYAEGRAPDGGPLFYSPIVQPGDTRQVRGTEFLGNGVYGFVCQLHPGMDGVLEVSGGSATPRPRVTVGIPAQALRSVRRTGRVTLTLRSSTGAQSVSVSVKAARRDVATVRVASLAAGSTRRVSARLTASGRRAIAKGRAVRFEATGGAEFGSPATAAKVLR